MSIMERRPLGTALAFQGGLVVVALVLALLFGLSPWLQITLTWQALGWSLLGTLPLVLMLGAIARLDTPWVREIEQLLDQLLGTLFSKPQPGAAAAVAIMAGISEELLFRGVVQDGLSLLVGTWPALLIAGLLFGIVHAVTRAYFWLATLMGIWLGWLYIATGNLLVPIVVHALYDWVAIRYYLQRVRDNKHQ